MLNMVLMILHVSSVFANPIEIDSKLFFQGVKIGSPRVMANNGEKAKILMTDQKQSREYSLEVKPKYYGNNIIQLDYNLVIKEKKNEFMSRGVIELNNNNQARILLDKGKVQIDFKLKSS